MTHEAPNPDVTMTVAEQIASNFIPKPTKPKAKIVQFQTAFNVFGRPEQTALLSDGRLLERTTCGNEWGNWRDITGDIPE